MRSKSAMPSPKELDELRALIEHHSGILFDDSRERFFSARVQEHLEEKNLPHVSELLPLIGRDGREYDTLLERLLTQETSFFRYPGVYEALQKKILPEFQEKKFWENPRTLRIWSAGCSTGEEPYSIALALADALPFAEAWEIEILATDISQRALRMAERGVYGERSLANLSPAQIETYFTRTKHGYAVKPRLRKMICFQQMNLAQAVYVGKLDCIFCMNVLMYFSKERKRALVRRFYDYLEPGGYFLLGHAETLSNAETKFESLVIGDCRMYRKAAAQPASLRPAALEKTL